MWWNIMPDWGFLNFWGLIMVLAVVDLPLKGFALWKSARASQKWWFVALFLINSLGILPAIYLLIHRTPKSKAK